MGEDETAVRDLHVFRGQIWPRRHQILLSPTFLVAILVGVAVAAILPTLPSRSLPISEAVSNGFTFAAIAMGVCISALVLSLGLPGTERLRRWARHPGQVAGKSVLSDLVFTLAWAGLVQIGLIIVCVLAGMFGGDIPLAPSPLAPSHWLGLSGGFIVFFYAVFELLTVVQTLIQIGVMIIAEEKAGDKEEATH